ncbi:MAG: DNA recombination protein RmuC [Fibrobacteres bacterium]|jgi:DNA recombination protein RmuC|nr:DNA recombination protein RmuC [Fibrobacterota bacterium]
MNEASLLAIVLLFLCSIALGVLALWNRNRRRILESSLIGSQSVQAKAVDEIRQLSMSLARAEAERDGARSELDRHLKGAEERNALVRAEIENLSNRIFEEKSGKFKEIGTAAIAELVGPVRENLEKLQKALQEAEKSDAVRERSLQEALERVSRINARLGTQADGLAKALKGDNRLVGEFGEVLLEQLLEFSGLRRGVHFVDQGEGLSLKGPTGQHLKPDVVILLPENRCLVVDAKMSLASWSDAQTDIDLDRAAALEAFRRSVRAHMDNLSSKDYTAALDASGRQSVDFTFLFVPVEAAFQACLGLDRNLYRDAFQKRIILTSPTTLLAMLTTVTHTWRQFELGRNAEQISERARLMLAKLTDFLGSMEQIGDHLDRAQSAFGEARKRLVEGNGNLVGQATKLVELGVKRDKSMPRSLQGSE